MLAPREKSWSQETGGGGSISFASRGMIWCHRPPSDTKGASECPISCSPALPIAPHNRCVIGYQVSLEGVCMDAVIVKANSRSLTLPGGGSILPAVIAD